VIWEFEKVIEGRLSLGYYSLDPVWHHVASHLAERLIRLPSVGALVVLFFALHLKLLGARI